MQINPQAPVVQTKELFIQAEPQRVWAVLTDVNRWVHWQPKITKAQLEGAPAVGARFRWTVNGASIRSIVHTAAPHTTFGWSGVTFGGSAIHNWSLLPQNGGTLVQVEESMEGWLVGLFKNKMNRDLARDMAFWLEQLRIESEQG